MKKMIKAFFITGTDTNVGKTYIACALLKHFSSIGLKSVGMKPVSAGIESHSTEYRNEDVIKLSSAGNVNASLEWVNPYSFPQPVAPNLAAGLSGVAISCDKIIEAYDCLSELADVVIVEGAGGVLVPLNDRETIADLAIKMDLPMILVVGIRLGCINHALLSVEAIQSRGLKLAGWVANQIDPAMEMYEENVLCLKERISAPCISEVKLGQVPVFKNL